MKFWKEIVRSLFAKTKNGYERILVNINEATANNKFLNMKTLKISLFLIPNDLNIPI